MIEQILSNEYLRASSLFIILLLGLRIIISILERIVLKLVSKTKTDIDDIIIKRSSVPITTILFLISLRISLEHISFSENISLIIHRSIYSGIVIATAYIIYVFVDILVFRLWKEFTKRAKIGIGESLGSLIHGLTKIILIALSILYILDLWGINIGPLLAGLGIAGLAIALALQPALGNIFSGVSVILDNSVGVGDVITLDAETSGTIEKIGLRSTKIRTYDNELVIIPNSTLADSRIQNVALPEPKTRVVIPFGVAYGSDIDKVKKIVLDEIKKIKNICNDPEPSIKFTQMADSSLNFKVYFHVESYKYRLEATDEANTRIYKILNKNKIEIPFPQIDVHLKKK